MQPSCAIAHIQNQYQEPLMKKSGIRGNQMFPTSMNLGHQFGYSYKVKMRQGKSSQNLKEEPMWDMMMDQNQSSIIMQKCEIS